MMRQFYISDGKILAGAGEQCPVFLYISPDENERKYLVELLKIDEHTLISSLDPDEMARLEFEPEHTAMIIKQPKHYSPKDNFLFRVLSIGIFAFADKLIIVLGEDLPLFEGRRVTRVTSFPDLILKIIARSIYNFEDHLKVINACSDQLEKEINTAMENRHLLNLFTLEKSLVYYINAISSNKRVIEKIKVNAGRMTFNKENVELLDDIEIENSQCFEQAQVYSQVLSGLMDARASIVSNNLNVLMKTLNIIMVAIMLPSLWLSIFSMNVPIPFQQDWRIFWFIIFIAAVFTYFMIRFFRNKR